jgi:hypothetical protein
MGWYGRGLMTDTNPTLLLTLMIEGRVLNRNDWGDAVLNPNDSATLRNGGPVPHLITPFSFHPHFLSWRTGIRECSHARRKPSTSMCTFDFLKLTIFPLHRVESWTGLNRPPPCWKIRGNEQKLYVRDLRTDIAHNLTPRRALGCHARVNLEIFRFSHKS